ncbi:MAG: hypothetical protein ACUVTZ_10895 [Armatimonadota bacterium]
MRKAHLDRQPDLPDKSQNTSEPAAGVSRRNLLKKASWTVPIVMSVSVAVDAHGQMSTAEHVASNQAAPKGQSSTWPEDEVVIAGLGYGASQFLPLLKDEREDNPTRRLVKQLIIAKAGIARGAQPPQEVLRVIELAEERLRSYGVLCPHPPPPRNREDRRCFLAWARELEKHNSRHRGSLPSP